MIGPQRLMVGPVPYSGPQYTVWRKILTGEILTNGHLENFDEKKLTNSIMLMPTFIND